MAHASTSLADARSAGRDSRGILQALSRPFAWISEQRRVNRTIATLSDLSDQTLADIGIERSDIPRIARYGRDPLGR
jgi:uncharacterized protein YjiS (DUF1127 family)